MKHNWEYKRLGDICLMKSGNFISAEELDNSFQYPCFGGNGIRGYIQKYSHEGDLVIIGRVGALCGNVNQFNGRFYATEHAIVSTPIVTYLSRWLYYELSFINLRKFAKGAAQPVISVSTLNQLMIPIPPMDVQQQIVAELDKINEVIEDCRELLRNLDVLAQSLFYDYFGDPVTNPKEWDIKTWSDCLTIINGKNQKTVENPKGQFPIYGSGGIMSYADAYLCPENCTIIGRKGNISKPIFVKTKFWNVDTAFGLCPNKSIITPLFLYFFCKNYDFEKHNKAVTIPSLVKNDLLKIKIPVPPLPLQQKFAARIEQIEAQKKAVEQTIAELQTLLDSRMDYWFN